LAQSIAPCKLALMSIRTYGWSAQRLGFSRGAISIAPRADGRKPLLGIAVVSVIGTEEMLKESLR